MANFHRVAVYFLLIFSANLFAAVPATVKWYNASGSGFANEPSKALPTQSDVEADHLNWLVVTFGNRHGVVTERNYTGEFQWFKEDVFIGNSGTPAFSQTVNLASVLSCEEGSPVGNPPVCNCPTGKLEVNGVCLNPDEALCQLTKDEVIGTRFIAVTAPVRGPTTVCDTQGTAQCAYKTTFSACGSNKPGEWTCELFGLTGTGDTCTPSLTPTIPSSPTVTVTVLPNPPPSGTCPGNINGVDVFVPCDNRTTTGGGNTSTTSLGGGTPTTGSTGSTGSTSCTGSLCSTSTTVVVTGPGGVTTTVNTRTTTTLPDLCAAQPTNPLCTNNSSFGGACGSNFTCKGDAIQCAIAKEQHVRSCELFKESDESQLYSLEKTTPVRATPSTFDLSGAPLNSSNLLGVAAGCLTPVTLSIMGSTVVVPFTALCDNLAILGNIGFAAALLLGARILTKG